MALPFPARHDGWCEVCDDPIYAGDMIISDGNGVWVHVECTDQEED